MNKFLLKASNRMHGQLASEFSDAGGGGSGTVSDDSLVKRAQQGDLKAYDELVTRHRGKVFAMIRNMVHNEADAWDLSQDVFIKAWHALGGFEAKAKFSTWLFRISHNVVYDSLRKRKIQGEGELNDEIFNSSRIDPSSMTTPSVADRPDHAMAHDELRRKIERALAQLSPDHREVVLLKDVQGFAYKEIADATGCSLGTVMSRLYYARQKLQTLLKDEYEAR
jgi:RNA polymerase sigma-70 factor (ECF subfamily)